LNVGSGGGAAAAPVAGGGAAAGGDAAEEKKEEKEEEGMNAPMRYSGHPNANSFHSQGGIRRGYGLRSLRLDYFWTLHLCTSQCMAKVSTVQYLAGRVAPIDKQAHWRNYTIGFSYCS